MDPKVYEKPEIFNPQRYVDNPNLPLHAFGFGRRYEHFSFAVCYDVHSGVLFLEDAQVGVLENRLSSLNLQQLRGHSIFVLLKMLQRVNPLL